MARAIKAADTCRTLGITQGEIAEALGASQSQVSRILQAKAQRPSRLFEEVCLYVEWRAGGVTADAVRANDDLIGALQSTWDGSAAHARALSAVIRSLGVLGPVHDIGRSCAEGKDAC